MITATAPYSLPQRLQRLTASENASAVQTTDHPDERQQAASSTLDALRSIVENEPRERKAQAEETLKRLKDEMMALMQWGFAPGATAQRSLQLAKQLGSATAQFSDAILAGKNMQPVSSSVAATADTSMDRTDETEKTVEDAGVPEAETNVLPQAYRDILNDDVPDRAFHSSDKEVADFRNTAQQLQFMLEDATRRLHRDGRPAAFTDQAKDSFATIDHALSRLDRTSGGVASHPAVASILLL
ncbi:hypothetical protein [Rhizobium sp. PL01]|uniref:hypothetical protein n=1 Tax=Rhizobium sp. PL01 TaxID=3085631 RepID=UPI002982A6E3|nr:hypothetical protein [Rhizobium sp. PL01]MDW5313157.1 hypothetical protein [Rhizobium sp. PL01]